MRPLAGLAIACSVTGLTGLATTAAAQAFAPPPSVAAAYDAAAELREAAFLRGAGVSDSAYDAPAAQHDPITGLLEREAYRRDEGLTRWGVKEVVLGGAADGSAVDSIRLRVGEATPLAGGRPLDLRQSDARAYDVTLTRNWPGAVSFENDRYDVDLTPHAGFGVGSLGGSAEAGATLTLGRKAAGQALARQLKSMGFREADANVGRWYVFAAASGRAVGLSLASRDPSGGWSRTQESSSALIGDAQLGVGWRKGAMQTSLGYIHRSVKGDHMLWGAQAQDDSMVAFSLSIKPKH